MVADVRGNRLSFVEGLSRANGIYGSNSKASTRTREALVRHPK